MNKKLNKVESVTHLEASASHEFSSQENHKLPTMLKVSITKHQTHGHLLIGTTHRALAQPYIDLHRGDHHFE